MTILLLDKFGRVPDVAKYLYSFAASRWPASVVLAQTKDHMDWELIGQCSEELEGAEAKALKQAYEELEDQEDVDLYHTKSWSVSFGSSPWAWQPSSPRQRKRSR